MHIRLSSSCNFNAETLRAKTLHFRLQEQNSSALSIAEYLESHPKVQFVHNPLLKSYPQYSIVNKI